MKKFAEQCINQLSASMGAGASTFQSSTSSPFSRSGESAPTCDACSIQFTVFKRKRPCSVCKKIFCTSCLLRDNTGVRTCNKCRVLSSRRLSRSELMQLKIKDLRQYLLNKNVTMDGCKEKKDLVELIMKTNHGQSYPQQQQAHEEWVEELARQHHQETQTDLGDSPLEEELPDFRERSPRQSEPTTTSPSPSQQSFNHHTAEQQTQSAENNQDSHPNVSEPSDQGQQSPPKRMTLEQLQEESDIDELTVRQLKEVLANNFVDYKGCCEKRELIERTKRLWNENLRQLNRIHSKNSRQKKRAGASNQSQKVPQSDSPATTPSEPGIPPPTYEECLKTYPVHGNESPSSPTDDVPTPTEGGDEEEDDGLCKICMDAPIDCVLLECGHFVSCTKCGKRLSECPICRQYVVRAVHVFRA